MDDVYGVDAFTNWHGYLLLYAGTLWFWCMYVRVRTYPLFFVLLFTKKKLRNGVSI